MWQPLRKPRGSAGGVTIRPKAASLELPNDLAITEASEAAHLCVHHNGVVVVSRSRRTRDFAIPFTTCLYQFSCYVDAARMLPHIPREQFPGQALAVELYRHAGIGSVEILPGDVRRPGDYVVEAIPEINGRKNQIRRLNIIEEPPFPRHFSARFRPAAPVDEAYAGSRARLGK